MTIPAFTPDQINAFLKEDIGSGDITAAIIPETVHAEAELITREAMVLCGKDAFDASGLDDTDVYAIYGQAVVGLAPGVWIIPEAGYFDYGDDMVGNDAGSRWYAGAKWQIDF